MSGQAYSPVPNQNRSSVASRTQFDILAVNYGDESEEEQVPEPEGTTSQPQPPPSTNQPVKLTKTAQRKAAKVARLEQQRKRLSASVSPAGGASPSAGTPAALPSDISSALISDSHEQVISASSDHLEVVVVHPATETVTAEKPVNGHAHAPVDDHTTPAIVPIQVRLTTTERVMPNLSSTKVTSSAHLALEDESYSATTSGRSTPLMDVSEPPSRQNVASEPQTNVSESEKTKKRQNVFERTLWTFIMIGGFLTFLLMGHAYMIILVMICQTLVYREVTRLFTLTGSKPDEKPSGKDPWSKTLNWYFFAVTNYFLYGESIIYYFKHVVFADANLMPFATNHRIISFTLYTIGFMGFVMSLKKGYLKQQFGLFCWVHMSLLLIVVSSHFIVNNILEGLIWFWVPASLVICNDVFAYVWGITIGRTPLIKLSPKKTVEGFVGAFVSTIVFAILWGTYFSRFDYMICPVHDLGVNVWSGMHCTPNPVFVWREWQIWKPVAAFLSTLFRTQITRIHYAPYQIHLFFMACFASLVAPFGGFFASGFKRAFNIKDFGHSIPGHGGMTDRMDCQFLMGVFTYVYYSSLIREHHVTVGSALQTIVSGLTVDEQLELIADLKRYLEGQGLNISA